MTASLIPIARLDALSDDAPAHAEADGIDLVLVRRGAAVHVFEGRCPRSSTAAAAAPAPRRRLFPAVAVALLSRAAQPVAP
jgi:hypothetical protein